MIGTVTLISAIVFVALPWIADVDASPTEDVRRVRLLAGLAWSFVALPTAMWVYFWLPESLSSLVDELRTRGVLSEADGGPGLEELDADLERRMTSPRWPLWGLVAVAVLIPLLVINPVSSENNAESTEVPGWLNVIQLATSALLVFGGTILICRLVAGTLGTNVLLRSATTRVIPLHSDEAGGWSPLGDRVVVLARAAAIYGVVAAFVFLGIVLRGGDPLETPAAVVTILAFLALPPLVVWAWLFAPHRAMLAARAEVIEPISAAFESAQLRGIHDSTSSPDEAATVAAASVTASSTNDWLDALLTRREQLVKAYPAWPLGLSELRGVWATAFLPVVSAVVGAVANLVASWVPGG